MEILCLFSLIFVIFCAVTFVAYKLYPEDYPTWESAMKGAIRGIATLIYTELSGKQPSSQIENPTLKLTYQESEELCKYLESKPYDTLRLTSYTIEHSTCLYEFDATGLIEKYKEWSSEEIAKMCTFRIQTFFKEKRGFSYLIYVDIQIATPDRLRFAIPLSEQGVHYLEKQRKIPIAKEKCDIPPQLEEEIDINQNK